MTLNKSQLMELLLELTEVPSVSRTEGEVRMGAFIKEKLLERIPGLKDTPKDLIWHPLPNDPLKRHVVGALVRSARHTADTVILTGHYDVVDVADFGKHKSLAFSPLEYTKALHGEPLEHEVQEDLLSGDYLFCRGIMDMKCGLAVEMALLEKFAANPSDLPVNVLFLAVPDEEDSSEGMRAAVSLLVELQEKEALRYLGAILTEPSSAGAQVEGKELIFFGTVGKLMPFFYCIGTGAHVGQYYRGLSATLLASFCNQLMEANPDLVEEVGGEKVPPPACLYFRDLRDSYSVTLPDRALVYYNLLTLRKYPADILKELKKIAEQAFRQALDHLADSAKNAGFAADEFSPLVLTFEEYLTEIARENPDIKSKIREIASELANINDDRERAIELLKRLSERDFSRKPKIVVGFLPPWYPHRENTRESAPDLLVAKVAQKVMDEAREKFGTEMEIKEFFGGICDLSYMGYKGSAFDPFCIAANMPGWGSIYRVAVKDLMKLDIPVLNIGPSGKDPHKPTERLYLPFSLEVFPALLEKAVKSFKE